MDFNRRKFTKTSWDDDDHHLLHHHMAMEDQTLRDQHQHQHHHNLLLPFDSHHQFNNFPLQTHDHDHDHHHHQFAPSSSSQLITPSVSILSSDLVENHVMDEEDEPDEELGPMKEMMYKIASMQPVDIDPATIRKPKRRNVRISDDPQSVAARNRRERISERVRILQRLVPGGSKLDTASMLEEAIRYVKFLKRQIRMLQSSLNAPTSPVVKTIGLPGFPSTSSSMGAETETHFNFRVGRCVDGFAFNSNEVISDKL